MTRMMPSMTLNSIELSFPSRSVTTVVHGGGCGRDAGRRALAEVPVHHGDHVDRGAIGHFLRDMEFTAIIDRTLAHPRTEYGFDGKLQLLVNVVGEIASRLLAHHVSVLLGDDLVVALNLRVVVSLRLLGLRLLHRADCGHRCASDTEDQEKQNQIKATANIEEDVKKTFSPEFLNRIDETIIFLNLEADQIGKIVEIQMSHLFKRLAEQNIELVLADSARDLIARQGYDPIYGARPLKRVIQQRIQNPLATELLRRDFRPGDCVQIDYQDGEFTFSRGPQPEVPATPV